MMQKKSFFIRDILHSESCNEYRKTLATNIYSSSIWPFTACISCINPITSTSSNWSTVLYGSEKISSSSKTKETTVTGIYYSGTPNSLEYVYDTEQPLDTTDQTGINSVSSLSSNCTTTIVPSSSHRKIRRNRTVFTELQLMGLERRFDRQKYLSTPDRAELARALGLTQLQVKTWYQNRRMKWKKQVMQGGCPIPPTKPKGRPKKNSIPSMGMSLETSLLSGSGLIAINSISNLSINKLAKTSDTNFIKLDP